MKNTPYNLLKKQTTGKYNMGASRENECKFTLSGRCYRRIN